MSARKNLGLMLMAMLFVTVALLYVTGPSTVETSRTIPGCRLATGGRCHVDRQAAAWERVYYAVVGE